MKKIILALITLTALVLVGCGKIDPSSDTTDKTPAIADSSVTETTKSQTTASTAVQTQITVATTVTSVATSTTSVTVTTAKITTATATSLESYCGIWYDEADTSEIAVYSVGNKVKFNMVVYHQFGTGVLAELIDGKYVFHTSPNSSASDFKGTFEFLSDGIKLTVTESSHIYAKVGDVFYFTRKDPDFILDIDGWIY